jgi:hypothetical protein
VSRREEQALASRLARALDGQEQPEGDLASLVTVLERATETARFAIPDELVERELVRVRPRFDRAKQPRRRRPASRLGFAFGAVAAAAVAVVVFTFVRLPGTDVEAKALAALGGPGTYLEIRERIEPVTPGLFPPSTRTVWLDSSRGLAHWVQLSGGRRVEEVLVERGRMKRYLPGQALLIAGSSCRAFASGCAELVDPVAFYRRALAAGGPIESKRDADVYRLTLPLQNLPDAVRIEHEVTIDARTFLPRLIEWRQQQPGGAMRPVSRIVIESIDRYPRSQAYDRFDLRNASGTKLEQRTASGKPLSRLGRETLTLAQARTLDPSLLWLGPEFQGRTLRSIDRIDWNAGSAYRVRYDGITVWNFSGVVPPQVLGARVSAPAKTVPIRGNVAHFYFTASGRVAGEIDLRGRSVAILAPEYTKVDVVRALGRLKPLG